MKTVKYYVTKGIGSGPIFREQKKIIVLTYSVRAEDITKKRNLQITTVNYFDVVYSNNRVYRISTAMRESVLLYFSVIENFNKNKRGEKHICKKKKRIDVPV